MDSLLWERYWMYLLGRHIWIRRSLGRRSRSSILHCDAANIQNNMKESLALFDQICNSRWFQKTSMILFLNKIDLFQAKLKYSSVSHYFPDFKGIIIWICQSWLAGDDRDYLQTSRFFQKKFIRLNKSTEKEVYVHFTNATGTYPLPIE